MQISQTYVSVCVGFEFGEVWVEYQNLVLDSKATRFLETKKTPLMDFSSGKANSIKTLRNFVKYITSKLENIFQFFFVLFFFCFCFFCFVLNLLHPHHVELYTTKVGFSGQTSTCKRQFGISFYFP